MENSSFQLHEKEQSIPYRLFYDCAGSYVPSHWHREVEVVMCKKGGVRMVVNNIVYELQEGDVIVIPDGCNHLYMAAENNERLVILFDYRLFEKGDNFKGVSRTELHNKLLSLLLTSRQWSAENRECVCTILRRLEELNRSDVFAWDLAVRARIFDLVFYLCNYVEKYTNAESDNAETLLKLDHFFLYIEQHYREPLTLREVAGEFGFSASYFARFFKKFSGQTFLNYLNAYRINKARDLLLTNAQMSISEISERVGIANVKTFNRLFRQMNGMSPTQYRKSIIMLK